jgi:uncharacterized short protein YbdD (DUF466 family)
MRERTGARAWGRGVLAQALGIVRGVAGMPDYEAYVAHLRRCHPERPVPSERRFYDEYVKHRYGDGPTRCC